MDNDIFASYGRPIGIGIIGFTRWEHYLPFTKNFYNRLSEQKGIFNKFQIYPDSLLLTTLQYLKIQDLNPTDSEAMKALNDNLNIKFLIKGTVDGPDSITMDHIKLLVYNTVLDSLVMKLEFRNSMNSSPFNDAIKFLSESVITTYAPMTKLTINVEPRGNIIKLDDREYANKYVFDVIQGKHFIEISKDGYIPITDSINISVSNPVNEIVKNYQLVQNYGEFKLFINSDSANCNLQIHNRIINSWKGNADIQKLEAGKYLLTIDNGKSSISKYITIYNGNLSIEFMALNKNSGENADYMSDKLEELSSSINDIYKNNNYYKLLTTVGKIYEISPYNTQIGFTLRLMVNEHLDKLLERTEIVNIILGTPEAYKILPLSYMAKYYYDQNNAEQTEKLIGRMFNCDSTISLLKYFYDRDNFNYAQALANKLDDEVTDICSVNQDFLFSLNRQKNPLTFKRIVDAVIKLVKYDNPLDKVFSLYALGMYDKVSFELLTLNLDQIKSVNLPIFFTLDPAADAEVYEKIAHKLVGIIPNNIVDTCRNTQILYGLSKFYFSIGDTSKGQKSLSKIYQYISPDEKNITSKIGFGLSALAVNEDLRAKTIFDLIFAYGTSDDLFKLKKELIWWKNIKFKTNFISSLLSSYFKI